MATILSKVNQLFYGPGEYKHPTTSIPEPPKSESPDVAPPITATKVPFASYGLPKYEGRYALVIDYLFTPEDCTRLLNAAEDSATPKGHWAVAQVNGGGGMQYTNTEYRNSGRIILDSTELADWILSKVRPYLGEIETIPDAYVHHSIQGRRAPKHNGGAKLLRLNERLRFLRYGPGQFFQPHCDGPYWTPDRKEATYYTLQIYLNGDSDNLRGGATRFWEERTMYRRGQGKKKGPVGNKDGVAFVDIESRMGRVIVFEHQGLLHSGEPVVSGLKYSLRSDFLYVKNFAEGEEEPMVGSAQPHFFYLCGNTDLVSPF